MPCMRGRQSDVDIEKKLEILHFLLVLQLQHPDGTPAHAEWGCRSCKSMSPLPMAAAHVI